MYVYICILCKNATTFSVTSSFKDILFWNGNSGSCSCAALYWIQFYIQVQRQKERKGFFFWFFNYEVTGPPGAGLQGMYVFILGRRVDAGFSTWLKLNRSFLSDLSALVQLHCCSWMFHGKVCRVWALPSSVCCLTETHLLWGRAEVKNSGRDKQRTPGATSDTQPPHPRPFGSQKAGLRVGAEEHAITRSNSYFWVCLFSRLRVVLTSFGCSF